jgi:hypothetical protein
LQNSSTKLVIVVHGSKNVARYRGVAFLVARGGGAIKEQVPHQSRVLDDARPQGDEADSQAP